MSFEISITLDDEDGIDPVDPLGTIRISDGAISILESCVYLDSWLWTMIKNLPTIESNRDGVIDLIDEPDPLEILKGTGGLLIRFKSVEVAVEGVPHLRAALVRASRHLIARYSDSDDYRQNEMLRDIASFANESA